jgi:predicted transcriptional regulator YdeE
LAELTPRFEQGRTMLLAGLRRHHEFAESVRGLPDQWHEFMRLDPIAGQIGKTAYGVMCGADPDKQTLEYMCGVEVEGFENLPAGLGRMRVPAQRYAVFTHADNVATIRTTWEGILNGWLPKSGFKSAQTPDFEVYDASFNGETGEGGVEIWIGITPET